MIINMGLDFYKIAAALGKEAIPLVQNMIGSYVDGKVMEKSSQLFDKKMDQSMMILNKHDPEAPGARKSPDKKIGLSTGILQNETKEELGRRKWKEYENHIEALPDSASPKESKKALKEIQDNISKSYPCESCKIHAIENLEEFPLNDKSVSSKEDAKVRLCSFHNIVNEQLGKEIVTCMPVGP